MNTLLLGNTIVPAFTTIPHPSARQSSISSYCLITCYSGSSPPHCSQLFKYHQLTPGPDMPTIHLLQSHKVNLESRTLNVESFYNHQFRLDLDTWRNDNNEVSWSWSAGEGPCHPFSCYKCSCHDNPSKNKTRPNCYKLSLGAHSPELVYQTQPTSAERIVRAEKTFIKLNTQPSQHLSRDHKNNYKWKGLVSAVCLGLGDLPPV